MPNQKIKKLRRKQRRRRKVRELKRRLESETDFARRNRLIAKLRKISPGAPIPDF
jgi:hypothetical protein